MRKQGGRTQLAANWKLSRRRQGAHRHVPLATSRMVRRRGATWFTNARTAAQATRHPGTWETAQEKPIQHMKWRFVLTRATGLSFHHFRRRAESNVKFDGKAMLSARGAPVPLQAAPHPRAGRPWLHRINQKLKGKIVETREMTHLARPQDPDHDPAPRGSARAKHPYLRSRIKVELSETAPSPVQKSSGVKGINFLIC